VFAPPAAFIVYREMLKTTKPEYIGIFGTSAGGSLTLTTLLRAKMERPRSHWWTGS
jgi:epsilon-lactone hydrolase